MSGLVAQHVPTSTSVLEVDGFSAVANYHEYEDCDAADPQIEEILEDDESKDEEEMKEYLKDAENVRYVADDCNSVSSSSVDEENADAIENLETCDIDEDEEICESKNVDGSEDIAPQSPQYDRESSRCTAENSGGYCYFNNVCDYFDMKNQHKDMASHTSGIRGWVKFDFFAPNFTPASAGLGVLPKYCLVILISYCLQCFDSVGWVAGRASGL